MKPCARPQRLTPKVLDLCRRGPYHLRTPFTAVTVSTGASRMMTRTTVAAAALAVLAGVASVQLGAQAPTSRPAAAGPTFAKDVAPILYKNCTNCHRPGEIAPMSLLTFKDARPWAKSIATRVAKGTMPPWHADPSHGEFLNDRRLSETEKN